MATFLFDAIVFGPVLSRRLGSSLGINLLPTTGKICSFDCIYCECGLNKEKRSGDNRFPAVNAVKTELADRLEKLSENQDCPDVITFAGNGEPTIHPDFLTIIKNTINARDKFCPDAGICVLSNSTRLKSNDVVEALKLVDMNILKLDSAVEDTVTLINQPVGKFSIKECIQQMKVFNGKIIIQTLFCRGNVNGKHFDNTTDAEVDALINALKEIDPQYVMIYSISRDTPINSIEKIKRDQLELIAEKIESNNIKVEIA